MFPDSAIDYLLKEAEMDEEVKTENCSVCGKEVLVMAFKGTGVCSEDHRKIRDGEVPRPQAQTDAGITSMLAQPKGVDPRGIR